MMNVSAGWLLYLVLRKAWQRVGACLVLAVCWVAGSGQTGLLAGDQVRPSIILISVDTLRADHLGCYGYNGVHTPHIDAIAMGGTLFTQVNTQVPLTLPAHVSLLTSTYPFANGVEDNGQQLGVKAVTLAAVLKASGYRTAAFVGGYVLDGRFGLGQGFNVYDSPFNGSRQAGKDPGDVKRPAEEVVGSALAWLEQNSNQPFFLFLHLYDLHTPYERIPELRTRFHGSDYDIELGYIDEQLGRFWEFLNRRELLKSALVVFLSDHGESLGDHGESTHGYFIYQSTLHVPLIIHWPEHQPATQTAHPKQIEEPVSLLDPAPTVLQFAGVKRPDQFQGRSLLGLLAEGKPAAGEEIYSESLYAHRHFGTSSLRCLRVAQFKYIEAPKPELYDLSSDPRESRNLYSTRKSLALSLHERLLSLRARFAARGTAADSQALSPEVVERLASLGYVATSAAHPDSPDSGPDPKDRIDAYERYGRALAVGSAGRLVEANAMLRGLLAQEPGLNDVRVSLGLNEQKLGDHADAVENFREVLKAEPTNALAHFDLAVSYFALRRVDDAFKELQVTLAISPSYTRAEELLGTIWIGRKAYDQAQAQFNHLLTVDPGNYTAHYNLGVLAALQGHWDEGAKQLQAALKSDPSSAEAHNTLGSVYLRQGNLERARDEFTEAVRLAPEYAWAHYNLGLAFRGQGRSDDAAREFRLALASDPQLRAAREALESLRESRQ
jgi:choline-sulfatase